MKARATSSWVLGWQGRRFYLDATLILCALSLAAIGFVMVCSASLHLGERDFNAVLHYPLHQVVHIGLGLICGGVITAVKLELWEKLGFAMFLGALVLLVLVLIPGLGVSVNGSVRWLPMAGIRVQVSECFKLATVIYLAGYIHRYPDRVCTSLIASFQRERWRESLLRLVLSPCGLLLAACFLLLQEPDFGSAVMVVMIAVGLFFLAGARLGIFMSLMMILGALGSLLVYVSPYRFNRLIGFLDPWADPEDKGYQLIQALIAFGRGEWFGVGLGSGIQKMFYLPEAHTDFLFSVIAEELGLLGVITVIVLFAILIWRAFSIGRQAELAGMRFGAFIGYGIGLWFGLQATINMGVNMGVLPTKGLTLPLMSYGGGSMLVMSAAIAFLIRVHHEVQATHLGAGPGGMAWAHG